MKHWRTDLVTAGDILMSLEGPFEDADQSRAATEALLRDLWTLGERNNGRREAVPAYEVVTTSTGVDDPTVVLSEREFDKFLPGMTFQPDDGTATAFARKARGVALAAAIESIGTQEETLVETTIGGSDLIGVTRSFRTDGHVDPRLARALILHAFELHVRHGTRNPKVVASSAFHNPESSATLRAANMDALRLKVRTEARELIGWLEEAGLAEAARDCADAIEDVLA